MVDLLPRKRVHAEFRRIFFASETIESNQKGLRFAPGVQHSPFALMEDYEAIPIRTMAALGFEPIAYYDLHGNLLPGPVQEVFLCTFYDGENVMTFLCSP